MRTKFRVPVYISLGASYFKKTLPLESQNVSDGGLCFETRQEIPLESKVLVGGLGELSSSGLIRGRVAHREMDPDTLRYTVSLEFTEFVEVTREALLDRIEDWQRPEIP